MRFANHPEYEREMLESAFATITNMEAWEFLENYDPGEGGFFMCKHPRVMSIQEMINKNYPGHSGSSLAFTMRKMQSIAVSREYVCMPQE